jgi:hypothetical protein
MVKFVLAIQHAYNPLHLYCRMMDKGFASQRALTLSRCYEMLIYKSLLLPATRLFISLGKGGSP